MRVIKETGQKGFLLWVKTNQPKLYQDFLDRRAKGGVKLGDVTSLSIGSGNDPIVTAATTPATPGWVSAISGALTGAAQVYLTTQQLAAQRKVLDLQLDRARQGLAPLPIDVSTYGLQPTVGVGLTPQTKQLLIYGGVGLAVVFLLPKLLGRR